ncbi:hypothetical protein [Nodosilinea sp. E11]|uniref:hypothetical protein n=1 Tax=Nodosilinea sp. E11 TaxID=3037479 RepID=UPI00293464D2|nr:hypothetical protein [Nodosilinea sp. E11]WOD41944.1 hypothetical protein RRF56_14205 [Nodosilinea sp. E11]
MMLRELKAFEACWLDLKDIYPTSSQDNRLIAHAMGQLVDLLEKPTQVEQELPQHLKGLFRQLAMAYFQGYSPHPDLDEPELLNCVPPQLPYPRSDRQRRQDIATAIDQVKVLAQKSQATLCPNRGKTAQCPISERETLIIDFPEHWHPAS